MLLIVKTLKSVPKDGDRPVTKKQVVRVALLGNAE